MKLDDGQKIYIPTSLIGRAVIQNYIMNHYQGRRTKNIAFKTKDGNIIKITVPVEANDSAAYNEVYRNNYKHYMK